MKELGKKNINTPHFFDRKWAAESEKIVPERDCQLSALSLTGRVLDVGGATGVLADAVRRAYPFTQVTVMDISSIACEIGRRRYCDVRFVCDDICTTKFRETFDVVMSREVLEHVSDLQAAIFNMLRMLRGGGRMFVGVPRGHHLKREPAHVRLFFQNDFETLFGRWFDEVHFYNVRPRFFWVELRGFRRKDWWEKCGKSIQRSIQ